MIPVSKISVVGDRLSKSGGSRWIAQRSVPSGADGWLSTGSPRTFHTRPSVTFPTGTEIGSPVSSDVDAARQAVGRVHGDRAHPVVAEVLLDLRDEDA